MSCEICGRSNCTRSFHSLDEQAHFDNIADDVKARAQQIIEQRLDNLDWIDVDGEVYIKLADAIGAAQESL